VRRIAGLILFKQGKKKLPLAFPLIALIFIVCPGHGSLKLIILVSSVQALTLEDSQKAVEDGCDKTKDKAQDLKDDAEALKERGKAKESWNKGAGDKTKGDEKKSLKKPVIMRKQTRRMRAEKTFYPPPCSFGGCCVLWSL